MDEREKRGGRVADGDAAAGNGVDGVDGVSIVGLGCRFPGGIDSPDSFWNLVIEGRNAVRELPEHRRVWQRAESKGGFLDGVDAFDAPFFGVSASEARYMDPQQRLLLEVAWEAMESAGIDPSRLAGRRVGVFVGSFTNDYELLQSRAGGTAVGPYFGTGTSAALLAGRLAYRFGMTGPALVVNTACSSSLVAMHLARRSLLAGESEFALVAGVNLILSDEISASFRAAGMLAPDAQCKPWDASADGYVRSEGCAAVLLEGTQAARARGARIWARVIGSAVNQDGASGGITAPSATAQQQLIEDALGDAGISPDAVQYVEAHGTGTPVGDPIEFEALARVFSGGGRRPQPLLLGSIKGNLGHTEAAAGLAGVIKVLLAMRHGQAPLTVNHRTLNPELQLERIPAVIPTVPTPWPPSSDGIRVAGVNSFGFSGTNAHVILAYDEEDAEALEPAAIAAQPQLLCLSAPTADVLEQVAARYEHFLRTAEPEALDAVCHTAYVGRRHFRSRLAVQGASVAELADVLAAYRSASKGRAAARHHAGAIRSETPRVAFLFTGQGAQYWGMGRELFETDTAFRQSLVECDAQLAPKLGCSLIELMIGARDATGELAQTRFTQPALFAFQVALSNMFQAWGIRPAAVLGHSVGEFAAAVTAGVMSLTDALTLIEARGRLMQALPGGGMTAVQASEGDLAGLLAAFAAERLSLAVVNGPNASVIAGDRVSLAAAHEQLAAQEIGFVELDVSHAFHTPAMRDAVEPFRAVMEHVRLNAPAMPFFSTVTGASAAAELTQADYWCSQIVQPVRFLSAVRQLDAAQFDACLEIGPSAVLTHLAKRCDLGGQTVWIGSQQQGSPGRAAAVDAVARLYTIGAALHHERIVGAARAQVVSLPTYPFQRKSFWIASPDVSESQKHTEGTNMTQVACREGDPSFVHADAKAVLQDYYKTLSERVRQGADDAPSLRPFIRFAPFAALVPGFTWLPTFLGRPLAQDMQARVDDAHGDMRAVLFGGVEFRNVRRVLDIGCGYSTDLIELAQAHGHLSLDGCNISEDQIDYGRRAIAHAGLEGRIRLHHLDSAKNDFPGLYDLVVSHQVIHHIRDKDAALRNVSEHLRKGACLVAAEIVSNLEERIDHDPSSAHFETKENWAGLLSRNQLRLVRCVDASQEIANYLHDDDFARTLREMAGSADASTLAHLHGPHSLGHLLRRGVASYLLLLVQRDYLSTAASLLSENRQRLVHPTPYAEAREALAGASALARAAVARAAVPAPMPVPVPAQIAAPAPVSAAIAVAPAASTAAAGVSVDSIVGIVAQLLECAPESLDREQTLVAQGLNSILAMDLTRRLKSAFGVSVTVKALLGGATIASLACSAPGAAAAVASAPVLPAASVGSHSDLLSRIGAMGEAEINRLLSQLETRREAGR